MPQGNFRRKPRGNTLSNNAGRSRYVRAEWPGEAGFPKGGDCERLGTRAFQESADILIEGHLHVLESQFLADFNGTFPSLSFAYKG